MSSFAAPSASQAAYLSLVRGQFGLLLSENLKAMSSLRLKFLRRSFNLGLIAFVYRKLGLFQPRMCFAPSVSIVVKPIPATASPIASEYISSVFLKVFGFTPKCFFIAAECSLTWFLNSFGDFNEARL